MQYRRYRAPREHGEVFVDPPLRDILPRLTSSPPAAASFQIGERSADDLRVEARRSLLKLAYEYTSSYRDDDVSIADRLDHPIVLSGHQPQLFHPGVWFKNFILSEIGKRTGATAINLVIDNDLCRSPTIRVPTGTLTEPRLHTIAYDAAGVELPYEERTIYDHHSLATFAERVTSTIKPLVPDPLVEHLWTRTSGLRRRTTNLGVYLAQSRHLLESACSLKTLEVPLSRICDTNVFHVFVSAMLTELPRLHAIYNEALAGYRRVNRVRSRLHPVPDLSARDNWLESPFWIWTTDSPQRKPLFVRRTRAGLELSNLSEGSYQFHVSSTSTSGSGEQLQQLRAQGIKIRPRALMTTMFARLFLSDVFLHGIGGGKYDQLTDAIIARYFDVSPPPFAVLTATWQLPLDFGNRTDDDVRKLDLKLRRIKFHPESFLHDSPETHALVEAKRAWIATEPPRGERFERHQRICELNEKLRVFVSERRAALTQEREQLVRRVRNRQVLASREFAFCLYPKESLCRGLLETARDAL